MSATRISFLLTLSLTFSALVPAASAPHWIVTWGASPAPQLADEAQMRAAKLVFKNQTLREIVHVSLGSNTVRIRLSNAFGKETVEVGAVHVALRAKGSEIKAGSDRVVTFGGRPAVHSVAMSRIAALV